MIFDTLIPMMLGTLEAGAILIIGNHSTCALWTGPSYTEMIDCPG
jgi:hypothetical protein